MPRTEYVLSVYASPPGMLSLAPLRHDHNASLWRLENGIIHLQRYWEFERVSGEKHHGTPLHDEKALEAFLASLLHDEGLSLQDLSEIWGTPGVATASTGEHTGMGIGLPVHSLAHLFSAISLDTVLLRTETIIGLAVDAGPDLVQESDSVKHFFAGCVVKEGHIEYFPVESPGPLWSQCRRIYGREEGTLMALESAASCRVPADVEAILRPRTFFGGDKGEGGKHGSLRGNAAAVISAFDEAVRSALASPERRKSYEYDHRFDFEDNVQSAVMKLVQQASWVVMERNITQILRRHSLSAADAYLALSGGFALNCPTNSSLLDHFGFRGLLAPPCVNDSGQSLGLALLGFHETGRLAENEFTFTHAFHGSERLGLTEAVRAYSSHVHAVTELEQGQFLEDIERGPVAWVRGGAEIGPRALGHRSLLGDPRSPATKTVLNEVKDRQWWRPVAPIVLAKEVTRWFVGGRISPYMLEVFQIRPEFADQVPAVLHLDGTARVQTLDLDSDPVLHELITAYAARTGVPMLANTSLNDKGEPIVENATQALNFCIRKGISVLYVGDKRVAIDVDQSLPRPTQPESRRRDFDDQERVRSQIWREWKDRGHDVESLFVYAITPQLRRRFAPEDGGRLLDDIVAMMLRFNPVGRDTVKQLMRAYGPDRIEKNDRPPYMDDAPADFGS